MNKENVSSTGLMIFSPPKPEFKAAANTNNDCNRQIPSILCEKFQKALWMEFDTVLVKSINHKQFKLLNPNNDRPISVSVDKVPEKKGFSISLGETPDGQEIVIPPNGSAMGTVYWIPQSDMAIKEVAVLKLNKSAPLQISLHGTAGIGQIASSEQQEKMLPRRLSMTMQTIKPPASEKQLSSKRASMAPVISSPLGKSAQHSRTILTKKLSVVKDENVWAEKQLKIFTELLNYTYSKMHSNTIDGSDTEAELQEEQSPITIEDSYGLKNLIQRRADLRIKENALQKFKDLEASGILQRMRYEVNGGHFMIRDDKDIHADLGLQELLFELLFSYENSWLKLGLETIFFDGTGATSASFAKLSSGSPNQLKKAFKTIVLEKLLSDPLICSQFTKQQLLYPHNEKKMKDLLKKHFLAKFLELVLLLDSTRMSNVIKMPMLFVKQSKFKSSKAIFCEFNKFFLKGEGDIMRHLSSMNWIVQFEQSYVDEFNYGITNIALDLRDGVRLARWVDLLKEQSCPATSSSGHNLTRSLRVPAISRLQKIHNVQVALSSIFSSEELDSMVKHIVDGNRDKTLVVLWKILFHFELRLIVDSARVNDEAKMIRSAASWRRSVYGVDDIKGFAVRVPTMDSTGKVSYPSFSDLNDPSFETKSSETLRQTEMANSLQEWCNSISSQYGVPVFNLTDCLADGRALCLLIHYYHPTVLPVKSIKRTSAAPDLLSSKAVEGEHKNFALLRRACMDIGGIPLMLPHIDSSNPPDEKAMFIFLGYLFARLIESSNQVRGAIRIQRTIRKCLPVWKARVKLRADKSKPTLSKFSKAVVKTVKQDFSATAVMPINVLITSQQAAGIISRKILSHILRKRFLLHLKLCEQLRFDDFESMNISLAMLSTIEGMDLVDNDVNKETAVATPMDTGVDIEEDMAKENEHYSPSMISLVMSTSNGNMIDTESILTPMLSHLEDSQSHGDLSTSPGFSICSKSLTDCEKAEMEEHIQHETEGRVLAEHKLQELVDQYEFEQQKMVEKESNYKAAESQLMKHFDIKIKQARRDIQEKTWRQAKAKMSESEAMVASERQKRLEAEDNARKEQEARRHLERKLKRMEDEKLSNERFAIQRVEEAKCILKQKTCAAIKIQTFGRKTLSAWKFQKAKRSIHTVQKFVRGHSVRQQAARVRLSIRLVQSLWRRRHCMKVKSVMTKASIVIQSIYRRWSARQSVEVMRSAILADKTRRMIQAVVKIQSYHRMVSKAKIYNQDKDKRMYRDALMTKLRQTIAGVLITRTWRQCRKLQSEERLKYESVLLVKLESLRLKRSNRIITTFVKTHLRSLKHRAASRKIVSWYRSVLPFLRAKKFRKGFLRLQAFSRSYRVRSKASAQIKDLRRRIKLSHLRAVANPSLQLGKKTTAALHTLHNSNNGKMISSLIRACEVLEFSTEWSNRCCEAFANSSAPSILLELIRSCNRSEPHKELLKHALVVLLNVGRRNSLAPVIAAKEKRSVDILVDLMQMFRDVKPIFCLSCELLCRLVAACESVKASCKLPAIAQRIEGIFNLIERKHRLDSKLKAINAAGRQILTPNTPLGKINFLKNQEPIDCIRHLQSLM